MKTLTPETGSTNPSRSILIYGEPKSGKTNLAISIAEAIPTLLIATEEDGWQDAFEKLSETGKKNLKVITPETLQDFQMIAQTAKEFAPKAIVVDSLTKTMDILERVLKSQGGKAVVNGVTQKLSLSSYGDLATLTIEFVKSLKATGAHLILTAGCDKESIENAEGRMVRYLPLFTGGKTGTVLPYEIRAICYLRSVNGVRELWFEASQQWLAGSNYDSLTKQKMLTDPTMIKVWSLFPRAGAPVAPKAKKAKIVAEVPAEEPAPSTPAEEPPHLDELTPEELAK